MVLNRMDTESKGLTFKTIAMIMDIKESIEMGDDFGVIGCNCPELILKTLLELGVEASARPMVATQPLITKFQFGSLEELVVDMEGGDTIEIGFIFYKK